MKSKVKSSKSKSLLTKRYKQLSRPGKILVVLLVLLAGSLVTTIGYSKWKENDLKAKAGRYARIYTDRYSSHAIAACQASRGGVPTIRAIFAKPTNSSAKSILASYTASKNTWSVSTGNAWWGNAVNFLEIPAKRNGWYIAKISSSNYGRSYSPGFVSMLFTPPCPGFE